MDETNLTSEESERLTPEDERNLLAKLKGAQREKSEAILRIIQAFNALIHTMIQPYTRGLLQNAQDADALRNTLYGAAITSIVEKAEKWDPNGGRLITYLHPYIRFAIYDEMIAQKARFKKWVIADIKKYRTVVRGSKDGSGTMPSEKEIASALDWTVAKVRRIAAAASLREYSLDIQERPHTDPRAPVNEDSVEADEERRQMEQKMCDVLKECKKETRDIFLTFIKANERDAKNPVQEVAAKLGMKKACVRQHIALAQRQIRIMERRRIAASTTNQSERLASSESSIGCREPSLQHVAIILPTTVCIGGEEAERDVLAFDLDRAFGKDAGQKLPYLMITVCSGISTGHPMSFEGTVQYLAIEKGSKKAMKKLQQFFEPKKKNPFQEISPELRRRCIEFRNRHIVIDRTA